VVDSVFGAKRAVIGLITLLMSSSLSSKAHLAVTWKS
jgi:hypothetical protein